MHESAPAADTHTVYLKDYQPPAFSVSSLALHFDLGPVTTVKSLLQIKRAGNHRQSLRLDGEDLELVALRLNGAELPASTYSLDGQSLTVHEVPDVFDLEIVTIIKPEQNSELSGLYKSGNNYCTQCEAEGFRRITYYPDRPDVLTTFTTTIDADAESCPVMLSNGNLVEQAVLGNGRHRATWSDPFPKPSYLFALVAGPLESVHDTFRTASGRLVDLFIYTEPHNIAMCGHAMASLKKAMAWDEENYGREYDLDRYMIVAVDDFNMGAMENKGLNIFNTQYVLAKPETATDADYQHIEGVIGHEYFHNWSGNRVTCRDWFQLSLKEGFTVFRDQQFSAAMGSPGVKRIHDVSVLRTHQFREDAGPMAHPVRPGSYQEIDNFYTATVYNKGAEIVRMLYHLLGPEDFRRGTDLYFERFDGRAVTTDDFVDALQEASGIDLSQFRLWYDQAGTPVVDISIEHDPGGQTFSFIVAQSCPPTPGQARKEPFQIPIAVALLDKKGRPVPLQGGRTEIVLDLRQAAQRFTFDNIRERPVPSVLRGFSAPVKLNIDLPREDWHFLMVHDSDPFARWEAGQHLALETLLKMIAQLRAGQTAAAPGDYVEAFGRLLRSDERDRSFFAETLRLPGEAYLAEFMETVDPDAIHNAREDLRRFLSEAFTAEFEQLYLMCADQGAYNNDPESMGKRALKNTCLAYLAQSNNDTQKQRVLEQMYSAHNMTDSMAALAIVANMDWPERERILGDFYSKWSGQTLVINKWFSVQAGSRLPDTLTRVRTLIRHQAFNIKNPNKVRALIGAFAHTNSVRFHDPSGKGYEFVSEYVLELDRLNPQIAARLAGSFNSWRRYDKQRQEKIRTQLEQILAAPGLSANVREIVGKSLKAA